MGWIPKRRRRRKDSSAHRSVSGTTFHPGFFRLEPAEVDVGSIQQRQGFEDGIHVLVLVDVFEARQLSEDEGPAHLPCDVVAEVEKELVAAVLIVEPLHLTSHDQRLAKEAIQKHLFWFRDEIAPKLALPIDKEAL